MNSSLHIVVGNRERESSQKEQKGFISVLRGAASSLVQSFGASGTDEKKGSGSRSRRRSVSFGRESGERSRKGRRRRHGQARDSDADEVKTTSTKKKRRTQKRGMDDRDHGRTAVKHDHSSLALSPYASSQGRVNKAIEKDDDNRWDASSVESQDI